MTEAPTKIWVPLHEVSNLVDVSDGTIIKGPGPYYVLDTEYERLRDALDAHKAVTDALVAWDNRGTGAILSLDELMELARAAVKAGNKGCGRGAGR